MSVLFKNKSIVINDIPTYIYSGEIQSFRIPYDQWKDRLEKMKAMGLNSVGTYFAWNFHSQEPGRADFTSPQHDIGKFLDMAADTGLYVIVRPGPYICNEWDLGGYPGWLLSEEAGDWRTGSPEHLKWCKQWYQDINAIIAPRQQTRGGAVILYQVENEHFWGEKDLMEGLALQALKDGIEVPLVSNGGGSIYETGTEYIADGIDIYTPVYEQWRWRGWFDKLYRTLPEDVPLMMLEYAGGTTCFWGELRPDEVKYPPEWLISMTGMFMAKGANLTNFFVAAGGVTPWGYNSDHISTNYMEDAAVAPWGGLGKKFYLTRLWAEAVNSVNRVFSASGIYDIGLGTDNPNVEGMARKCDDGTFYFMFNNTQSWQEYKIKLPDGCKLPAAEGMKIKPKSARMLMGNLKLTDKTVLDFCSTQIMKIWRTGNTIHIVTYDNDKSGGIMTVTSEHIKQELLYTCSEAVAVSHMFCSDCEINVYSISEEIAEKTWFIECDNETIPLFSNIDLIRPGKDEKGAIRAEIKSGEMIRILCGTANDIVINGEVLSGAVRDDGLKQFSFKPEAPDKLEFNLGLPQYKSDDGLWRTEEIAVNKGWKKIRPFDGSTDCLTETGRYQYRADFEVRNIPPATIEFLGITGVEAEFYLNGYKLGVFPEERPGAYHDLEKYSVSFPVEGIIKNGTNKIAITCNLIGRHNLGRHIYAGINRPAVLYGKKDEISIVHWREYNPGDIRLSMEQLKNIPPEASPCYDDTAWTWTDVTQRRHVPEDEFTNWHTVQWYRTKCKVPAHMQGKPLFIKLPAAAEAWIYAEGQLAGMINEHHSTAIDISAFSGLEEITIAIALRYTNWFRPHVLSEAPVLFTVDQALYGDWYIRKESKEELREKLQSSFDWEEEYPETAPGRLYCRYEVALKRPENLIAPVYAELDDNWKTHAVIYWNGYPIGMYAPAGPDRRFYIQDGIIGEVNSLVVVLDGYNTAPRTGSISFGVYEELVPFEIRLGDNSNECNVPEI